MRPEIWVRVTKLLWGKGQAGKTPQSLSEGTLLVPSSSASLLYLKQGIRVFRVNWGGTQSKPANTTSDPGFRVGDYLSPNLTPGDLTLTGPPMNVSLL